MADALALFGPRNQWCTAELQLTREAQMFIRELWRRSGGAFTDGADTGSVSTVANEALSRVALSVPSYQAVSFGNAQALQEVRAFMPRFNPAPTRPDEAGFVIAARVFAA